MSSDIDKLIKYVIICINQEVSNYHTLRLLGGNMEKKDNQYKDAHLFIAYKGQEIDHNTIINVLKEIDTIGHGTVWIDGLNTLFVNLLDACSPLFAFTSQ